MISSLAVLGTILASAGTPSTPPAFTKPSELCRVFEEDGAWGAPTWTDDGFGNFGCATQFEVGQPGRTGLPSAIQFRAESTSSSEVQRVSIKLSLFNPGTRALALKRFKKAIREFFERVKLEPPRDLLPALDPPRQLQPVRTPYGRVSFARDNVNIEAWYVKLELRSR